MLLKGKRALVTGGSRGIGRGIALKLARCGADVAVHYYRNEEAAHGTLARVRGHGVEGCLVQADVARPDEIARMVDEVQGRLGAPDIFVSNARPDLPSFYRSPLEITAEHWHAVMGTQAQAFLHGAQAAARLMPDGGRMIGISYSPSGRTRSRQPRAAMGPPRQRWMRLCATLPWYSDRGASR